MSDYSEMFRAYGDEPGENLTRVPPADFADAPVLLTRRREFEIEGDLEIRACASYPVFLVDDCHLSELVSQHFKVRRDLEGNRHVGRVKIIIVPISE